jgi:hypothetical protein
MCKGGRDLHTHTRIHIHTHIYTHTNTYTRTRTRTDTDYMTVYMGTSLLELLYLLRKHVHKYSSGRPYVCAITCMHACLYLCDSWL